MKYILRNWEFRLDDVVVVEYMVHTSYRFIIGTLGRDHTRIIGKKKENLMLE